MGIDDATVQNGTLLFNDDVIIQCVAVSLTSSSPGSCLSLSLSTSSTVSGLTLSPSLATICVVSNEGKNMYIISPFGSETCT